MNWKITPEIAYDIGVHIGDGNMYSRDRTHRITYSGNLTNEKEYYRFLMRLIKKAYNVNPICIERPSDNTILIVVNSRELVNFKTKSLKLPIGPKDNVGIPQIILKNKSLLKLLIRGLADTDWSLSFKKNRKGIHTEPRLEIYTKSQKLAKQLKKVLKRFSFTFSLEERKDKGYHGYLLRMYGNKNLERWLQNFGFSNSWIKLKIQIWKKFGYFPIRKSYYELLNLLKN